MVTYVYIPLLIMSALSSTGQLVSMSVSVSAFHSEFIKKELLPLVTTLTCVCYQLQFKKNPQVIRFVFAQLTGTTTAHFGVLIVLLDLF